MSSEKVVKHTAGPWGYGLSDGVLLATISAKGIGDVAHVYRTSSTKSNRGIDIAECHANARLIAAAPELLEALQNFLQLRGDQNPHVAKAKAELLHLAPEFQRYLALAEAALSKAGGK